MIKRPILIITVSYLIGILLGLYFKLNIVPILFFSIIFLNIFRIRIYLKKLNLVNNKNLVKDSIIGINTNELNKKFNETKKIEFNKIVKKLTIKYSNLLYNNYMLLNICLIVIIISNIFIYKQERKYDNLFLSLNEINCIAEIVEVRNENEYYNNYIVKIVTINNNEYSNIKNIKLLLKVKKQNSKVNNQALGNNELKYGDLINIVGSIELPEGRRNYKGFDYSIYLRTKKVHAICKTDKNNVKVLKHNSAFFLDMLINNLQNKIKYNITSILSSDTKDIALAFFLGESEGIEEEVKKMYSGASLSHILAISGMHISYVITGCSYVLSKCSKRTSKYVFILFLIFFTKLTGSSPSVLRAVIMAILIILSKLFFRKSDVLNNIGIASFILLIYNPYYIFNLGFELSFLGTLGIVLYSEKINRVLDTISIKIEKDKFNLFEKIKNILSISISANILIFPILVYYYNNLSLIFLISNLLVTPILGIISLCGYITVLISLVSLKIASIISAFLNILIQFLNFIARLCSNITFLNFTVCTPNLIEILVYYFIIIYIFSYYNKRHNKFLIKCISAISIIVIISNLIYINKSFVKIYFIDVGQGDSTLIITESNKKVLIDGGGSEFGSFDVGESVLVPYLLDRKIKNIDYIIFSHFDSDHCLGLFSVMEKLNVKNVIISKQGEKSTNFEYFSKLVKEKKINVMNVKAGDRINIDKNLCIDILWPIEELIQDNILNNNSIVCKMQYNKTSILFTGDIEEIAEKKILDYYNKVILKSTILKVAHHGSKSSSIEEFVENVSPKIALIGVGANNKFGHPSELVLERYNNIGTRIYRTDMMGEITLTITNKGNVKVNKFLSNF